MANEQSGIIFQQWAVSGDEDAFKVVYETFYHTLLGLACRYVDHDVARDIVQDIFLGMWNDPRKYLKVKDLRFYLCRSIQNRCLNYLRDKRVEDKFMNRAGVSDEDFFYHALLEEDIFVSMREAINRLPQIYRDVLLCSLDGLSDKEISQKLHISVDNVKTRKKRGKAILKSTLQNPVLLFIVELL